MLRNTQKVKRKKGNDLRVWVCKSCKRAKLVILKIEGICWKLYKNTNFLVLLFLFSL